MAPSRLLIGPVSPDWAAQFLPAADDSCRWFPPTAPNWAAVAATFPAGWSPDALLVRPGYASVPAWVTAAPVPVVALAHDPNLLWHYYRHSLPAYDLVLTDAQAAERFRRAGLGTAYPANLYGLDHAGLAEVDAPDGPRDIDVLFVGNLNPAVHGDRLGWLGRVARLGDRFRVVIRTGVFGDEYRALVRRAKVVFNRSIRGECNQRVLEAAAGGAVLFQEADNREVPVYLSPDLEYVRYTAADLEAVLIDWLGWDADRRAVATRARARVRGHGWLALVRSGLAAVDWSDVAARAGRRATAPARQSLAARVWQRASRAVGPDADPDLRADVRAASDDHALAVVDPSAAVEALTRSTGTGNRVSGIGLGTALVAAGRRDDAIVALRGVLSALDADPVLTAAERDACPYPPGFDYLRVGWDRAGWDHPDAPDVEGRAKHALLRCRAESLLAELTGDLEGYQRATTAGPDLPTVRAAFGCALARAGQPAAAVDHLTAAVDGNPFDRPARAALVAALTAADDPAVAARVSAIGDLVSRVTAPPAAPPPAPSPPTTATPTPRVVNLSPDEFAKRFGTPDTAAALSGFTPPADTRAVLTLVAHVRPLRVLEIGTAAGHMTANLTAWTPPDAVIFSLGVVSDGPPPGGAKDGQAPEIPPRAAFARHADHFRTGHKARLIVADSRTFEFDRLAPLDLVFVDGGHDFPTARSDSLEAYNALRPGGCLIWHDWGSRTAWVKVREAVASLGFPEPVYHPAGTEVAFLFKGEGIGAATRADRARVAVAWEGEFEPVHSLAVANRAVCGELIARGHAVAVRPTPPSGPVGSRVTLPADLAERVGLDVAARVTVRHRWPPDFTPPTDGAFVMFQPWEYGRLPRSWVRDIIDRVDEVWVPSRVVERAFVASGVPADRVAVVPYGVDPDRFRPGVDPLPLTTTKGVKLLFVGGTLRRKGFDTLLAAYRRAFAAADDVCLVIKEFGAGAFYRGQTAEAAVAAHRADPAAPAVEYLAGDLAEADVPRLYAACDALVLPYRREGFGLPVLEAMAAGLPVVVTAGGPTDEFVPPAAGWHVPARVAYLPTDAIGSEPTVGTPWWLEPDVDALVAVLRAVAGDAAERQRRGAAGRRAALGWTWARTAAAVEDRVRALRGRAPVRFRRPAETGPPMPGAASSPPSTPALPAATPNHASGPSLPATATVRPRVSLTMIVKDEEHNLPACLGPVRDLVDEVVVVDTGSTDRTRAVAAEFGARVFSFPWVDHFAAARNEALARATGEFAFWLDADDRVDPENGRKLAALFAGLRAENVGYVMTCLCVPDGPGGTATAVDHVRLFRTDPRHRWRYRVHEQILPALRATGAAVRWADVVVRHVGYVDPALRRRKLARDLRLLERERDESPADPFTLFNLGAVYHELGDTPASVAALEASLAGSCPGDSIVRKLYALLAQSHRRAGDPAKALAACAAGRIHYPDDAELLFVESGLRKAGGDVKGTEELLLRLLGGREPDHFGSVDTGLRGHKARHNLACLYLETGRPAAAAAEWRAALADAPGFAPAHLGLGELAARNRDWAGVARAVVDLQALGPAGAASAVVLDGQALIARGEFATAREILTAASARFPDSVPVRAALSVALLQGGADPTEAEAAVRAVLALDPDNAQAKHNLAALYRNTGRRVDEKPPVRA
ncbi:glycosyltransferase [Fimbriiglobus ruber]|uniref:Glycosyl transferase, group 2 family protein n=1 Tax=Fimbriiglobus ruber TaxID=1908690 RepID=A0A225DDU5_9BACT|nr:glycosyltransferase [Fimbriiglobus ruber]OWK35319.1 Glycosyl transferase, group 2 family protein [Fimbriiglobus ruber]